MKREEHLKFCEICTNKKFDLNKGIICGLTLKIADFEDNCENFSENSLEKEKFIERKANIGASKTKRFINYIVDRIISLILVLLLMSIIPLSIKGISFFPLLFLYYFLTEYFFNKTFGKFLTKTRIVNSKGEKPTTKELLIRSLCRFIPFESFSFLSSNGKGWHDSISKTSVIDEK
jgi:hypothetical protein